MVNSIVVGALGALATIYLFNPTAGIIELIPDNIPVIGNLDEAAAAALVISSLAYFGVDLGRLFGSPKKKDRKAAREDRNDSAPIDADFVER